MRSRLPILLRTLAAALAVALPALGLIVMPLAGLEVAAAAATVTVCTAHGIAQMRLGADGLPAPLQQSGHHGPFCPACTLHFDAPAVLADHAAPRQSLASAGTGPAPRTAPLLRRPRLTGHPSRAPPPALA
jgi:hypothetical protein